MRGVREECHYHSMYHSTGWRSGEGCHYHSMYHSASWRLGEEVSLPLNVSQCRLEVG